MSKYAENTSVPADRSRAEIEKTLTRYGADGFCYGWEKERALIGFSFTGRHIRFALPMPDRGFLSLTPTGKKRSQAQIDAEVDKAVRQRWRALALAIKAKLESVESGITTFEQEFMAHIILPNGRSFGDWALPQIERAYTNGKMPALLPGGE